MTPDDDTAFTVAFSDATHKEISEQATAGDSTASDVDVTSSDAVVDEVTSIIEEVDTTVGVMTAVEEEELSDKH